MAGYIKYNENNEVLFSTPKRYNKCLSSQECISYLFRPKDYEYQGYLWNKLFKRYHIADLRFNEDIHFNEDRLFIIKYICKEIKRCHYTKSPIYKYYIRPTGAMESSKGSFNLNFVTDLDAYLLIQEELKKHKSHKNVQFVERSICYSCYRIKSMMRKYGIKNTSIECKIANTLNNHVSLYNEFVFFTIITYKKIRKQIRAFIYERN